MVCIIQVCSEEEDLTQAFHGWPLRSKVIHISMCKAGLCFGKEIMCGSKLFWSSDKFGGKQKWPSLKKRPVCRQNAQQVERQSQQGSLGKFKCFSRNPGAKDKATSFSHVE